MMYGYSSAVITLSRQFGNKALLNTSFSRQMLYFISLHGYTWRMRHENINHISKNTDPPIRPHIVYIGIGLRKAERVQRIRMRHRKVVSHYFEADTGKILYQIDTKS